MSDNSKLETYLFTVEIDGIETSRFHKCEGLEAETTLIEYEEGGGGVRYFKGRTRYPNIVLEKGINDNNELFKWYQNITQNEKVERKNGSIILKNNQNEEIKRWNFFRGFPCRWVGPKLDAKDRSSFAVERIEIAHEGIEVDNDSEFIQNSNMNFHIGKNMSDNEKTFSYDVLKMGGRKLNSSEIFDYLVKSVEDSGLMGKKYSTESGKVYVCTTFLQDGLNLLSAPLADYLPGGQRVVNSIAILKDGLFEAEKGKNQTEGTYTFYFDYGDGTGHTGFVHFDEKGNTRILHNGNDGKGNRNVNLRTRDSRSFLTWFGDNENGKLYYKKLEVEIWIE